MKISKNHALTNSIIVPPIVAAASASVVCSSSATGARSIIEELKYTNLLVFVVSSLNTLFALVVLSCVLLIVELILFVTLCFEELETGKV